MELSINDGDYIVSSIDDDQPHVPPYQNQHDLLSPVFLASYPKTALQIGVGYGALVMALEALGLEVTGLDKDLSLWNESRTKLGLRANAAIFEGPMPNHTEPGWSNAFDIIVADYCCEFIDPETYSVDAFKNLSGLLSETGIMSFNLGIWPEYAAACVANANQVFSKTGVLVGTQVLLCTNNTGYKFSGVDHLFAEEPDWLCSSANFQKAPIWHGE